MTVRLWRGSTNPPEQDREAEIERRALEILERDRCDWIEAWARAVVERDLIDERRRTEAGMENPPPLGPHRTVPGRVTRSEQIGLARTAHLALIAPGRIASSAVPRPRIPTKTAALHDLATARTIDDAATIAVERRGAGREVDAGVAAAVGAHLEADFGKVRVHDDALAQQATHAMGARAFAYNADVFLGPGETGTDLALMAHELTHVAQQGAAGRSAPQRQVRVGDADSPAERQADQVAASVVASAALTPLLVDGLPVGPGQMLKSQFIDRLRGELTATANQELGPEYSAVGCPYIDQYFARYSARPAAEGEALIRRYAPAGDPCDHARRADRGRHHAAVV